MATAQTIINRALRLCKVIDADGVASASEAEDAFDTLNGMLAEWHASSIGLPDYGFATLTTALASDDGDADAIAYQLALRVAPEYGAELSPGVILMAARTFFALRSRYFVPSHPIPSAYY